MHTSNYTDAVVGGVVGGLLVVVMIILIIVVVVVLTVKLGKGRRLKKTAQITAGLYNDYCIVQYSIQLT